MRSAFPAGHAPFRASTRDTRHTHSSWVTRQNSHTHGAERLQQSRTRHTFLRTPRAASRRRPTPCPVECFVSVSAACGDAVRGGLRSRVGRVASHGRVVGTRTHVKDSPLTTRTTQYIFVVALCVFQDPTGVRKIPWMTYEK